MDNTTMRFSRPSVAIAALSAAVLALAGCGSGADEAGGGDDSAGGGETGGTITIAEVNEVTGFNDESSAGNLDMNGKLAYLTRSSFYYLDAELNIVPDESFGTITVDSEDPLTVTYTINEDVVWSDGDPIDADDMLLAWAVQSAYYNDGTTDDEGTVISGTSYFDYAGDTSGLALTEFPEISEDNRSLTITYSDPYADYQLVELIDMPVHVVAEGGGTTVEELRAAFESAPRGDPAAPVEADATIRAAADFWNTGFDATSLPSEESLYLSSAAFVVDSWDPGQSMTLVRNEAYVGDLVPAYDSMVIRFVGDSAAQVTALQNGDVDVIAPQPSRDTLTGLEALSNATTLTGDQFSYDHLDLNINTPTFSDPAVREAFMKVVPRQQILESIILPLNPDAEVYDSQLFFPGTDGYDEAVAANGSDAYAEVDIEGARALLAGATPTVRILYNTENPNRVDAFTAISAAATEAGFIIEDLGSPDWSSMLPGGDYDASIFGWISEGVGVTGVPQIFSTEGGSNFNGFTNPEADALMAELIIELDTDAQVALQLEIENLIWGDFYGLPLFVGPGVAAYTDRVSGIVYNPGQIGNVWNFWEWTVSS